MSYFLRLDLPKTPLKDLNFVRLLRPTIKEGFIIVQPERVLTDELLAKFKEMNLIPKFVVLFSSNNTHASKEKRMIHTDLGMDDDGNWNKLLFGINWELEDTQNDFVWYDMKDIPEVWPESYTYKTVLNGIHYVGRKALGVPEGAVELGRVTIDSPTAVRTDLPHLTEYSSKEYPRVGVSVRFDESGFNDWQEVMEKLKPYELPKNFA